MTVKEVVNKIFGADTIHVYRGCEFICDVCKKDLDKDLFVLDSEVDSMEFTIYDGWGEDSNGERIIGFTSILVVNIK